MSKEVYETPDVLQEEDSIPTVEEALSDEIEFKQFSFSESFQHFLFKKCANDVDLSDSVAKPAPEKGQYEGLPFGARKELVADEHPLSRFERIKQEASELAEELESVSRQQNKLARGDTTSTVRAVVDGLSVLQRQLASMGKEVEMQSGTEPAMETLRAVAMEADLSHQVMGTMERMMSRGSKEATGDGLTIEFQLPQPPPGSLSASLTDLSALERRLASVEEIVGLPNSTSSLQHIPAILRLQELERKLALLNGGNLNTLQKKLDAVSLKLEAAVKDHKSLAKRDGHEAPHGLDDAAEERVGKLLDLMEKWDPVLADLPTIVSRLHSLRVLHEQSALFTQRLTHLETSQAGVVEMLSRSQHTLQTVQGSVNDNMAIFKENIEEMDRRFVSLANKMDALEKQKSRRR